MLPFWVTAEDEAQLELLSTLAQVCPNIQDIGVIVCLDNGFAKTLSLLKKFPHLTHLSLSGGGSGKVEAVLERMPQVTHLTLCLNNGVHKCYPPNLISIVAPFVEEGLQALAKSCRNLERFTPVTFGSTNQQEQLALSTALTQVISSSASLHTEPRRVWTAHWRHEMTRHYSLLRYINLEEFHFISEQLLETIAASCPLLEYLDLSRDVSWSEHSLEDRISNNGAVALIRGCPLLQHLDLSFNFQISDDVLNAMTSLEHLEYLSTRHWCNGCWIGGFIANAECYVQASCARPQGMHRDLQAWCRCDSPKCTTYSRSVDFC